MQEEHVEHVRGTCRTCKGNMQNIVYIIRSSVLCFSASTGTEQKTSYITLNMRKVFSGTIFKYLQGLTSSSTIYFNFFHYTVKSMLLSWLTHAHGYVHGYVRACSCMLNSGCPCCTYIFNRYFETVTVKLGVITSVV